MRARTPKEGPALRRQLERYLEAHPPVSAGMLADRLLIAAVDPKAKRPEVKALKDTLPRLLAFAQNAEAVGELTSLTVAIWALERLAVDVADLRFACALLARAVDPARYDEPFRSTARYWRHQAALGRPTPIPDVDDAPAPGPLRHAFATHIVFFAAGYGATPLSIDVVSAADRDGGILRWAIEESMNTVDGDDGDSLALTLLVAACLAPALRAQQSPTLDVEKLVAALAGHLRRDGGLRTRVDDIAARHHAACVGCLALHLLGIPGGPA